MTAAPLEQQVWAAALEFLSEAERSSASAIPRMTIHAAYYAMFHAARAVLLQAEGLKAPTKHNMPEYGAQPHGIAIRCHRSIRRV